MSRKVVRGVVIAAALISAVLYGVFINMGMGGAALAAGSVPAALCVGIVIRFMNWDRAYISLDRLAHDNVNSVQAGREPERMIDRLRVAMTDHWVSKLTSEDLRKLNARYQRSLGRVMERRDLLSRQGEMMDSMTEGSHRQLEYLCRARDEVRRGN